MVFLSLNLSSFHHPCVFHLHLHSGTLGNTGSGATWSPWEGKACAKEEEGVELTARPSRSQGYKMDTGAFPLSFQAVIN